jgi:hypothetical protein
MNCESGKTDKLQALLPKVKHLLSILMYEYAKIRTDGAVGSRFEWFSAKH